MTGPDRDTAAYTLHYFTNTAPSPEGIPGPSFFVAFLHACHFATEVELEHLVEVGAGVVVVGAGLLYQQLRRPSVESELTETVGEHRAPIDLPRHQPPFAAHGAAEHATEAAGEA